VSLATKAEAESGRVIAFEARRIHTMNPARVTATHIAVRDGRILGVGSALDMTSWGASRIDDRYANKVILPGFIEAHCHIREGQLWRMPYVGWFDRSAPDGTVHPGIRTVEALVDRLRALVNEQPSSDAPLFAWGFDPIYYEGRRIDRRDLDHVSTTRPIYLLHASMHLLTVNSCALSRAHLGRETEITGLMRDETGEPNGELHEKLAMFAAFRGAGSNPFQTVLDSDDVQRFATAGARGGCTTLGDMHNMLPETMVQCFQEMTSRADFPVRIASVMGVMSRSIDAGIHAISRMRELNSDKLYFGAVKATIDGSIQGFSARLRWPGYHNGHPNGIWTIAPQQVHEIIDAYHRAGIQVNIHTNGDEATQVAIDAIAQALHRTPRIGHRHTLQHCQLADAAQFRRIRELGICVNLFSNHLYYWGDQHRALTVGPERADRMNAAATALALGIPFAIHSDGPITPIAPLFTAWCAVNRLSVSGRCLGEAERIGVADSLRAITLGAAYLLGLDHCVGSLEVGKFADFTVLDEDPFDAAPIDLKDIPIHGTVLGGVPVTATSAAA